MITFEWNKYNKPHIICVTNIGSFSDNEIQMY